MHMRLDAEICVVEIEVIKSHDNHWKLNGGVSLKDFHRKLQMYLLCTAPSSISESFFSQLLLSHWLAFAET